MALEFECFECKCFTIFKEIESIDPEHRLCANCDAPLTIQKNLMRFDRTDKDKLGMLIPPEEHVTERLKALVDQLADLNGRIARIEDVVLDEFEIDTLDS